MERLRHDDPSHVGPYVILARLDTESTERTVPERRYLGRTADGERTALVCVPRVGADPSRWAIEAEGARRLSVPRFLRIAEVGGTAGFPWYAAPYTPALPLPAVLAAYGGPLPEDTVRRLGAALAEALTAAHAQGVTHAGLSPAAVLVTPGGPVLACFGAVRAAAPDGTHRTGLPGLDPGCLAVEQASGGRPRPLGDVFALGAVLAYASTGHTVPEQSELPPGLRMLVGSCLSSDPAARPRSAQEVLGELVSPGAPAPSKDPYAQAGTVLDHGAVPLPGRVVAALAAQSAALLSAELPAPHQPFASPQKVH
ncbi:serine/threonine protein kinase [Streptomyces sp. MB09-01]|uniref:serine/threonine protein kinase n=1 Tax=Streptomyces sp. MB09-01 TaxID=3028666 RepID=UPI0029A38BF9|nr:serine/threonine protein kinase [Streptomyces sp. MB09-01]MDX3536671.1 serine/threonine protein kinase [Streptomyces sp. MB09-01]